MSRLRWALLLVLILIILAFKFLPWYVLAVLLVFSAPVVGRWQLYQLFLLPFKAKGAVLHRAAVTVHALEPAARPAPAEAAAGRNCPRSAADSASHGMASSALPSSTAVV